VATLRAKARGAQQVREVANWLLSVTRACDTIHASRRLQAVTQISQARLLATAIHLRDDISTSDRERLLARWEKVSFRIYGLLGRDARTRVGEYVRLAWIVVNARITPDQIDSAIHQLGKDFPIEAAIENMRGANCYEDWERELRYFMFRYEEHL